MKKNISMKFILILSLITMFLWLASNGCRGRTADAPSDQSSSAQITVSSRQIAGGEVVLDYLMDQTVTVQNTGSGNLTIGQIAQANPLAAPFSIQRDNCSGQAVQPSSVCSFLVRFRPTSAGAFADSFDIPSDASNERSVTVEVSGSGIAQLPAQTSSAQITVSSRQIDYGNVVLNNITDQAVTVRNTGTGNLTINQIAQANALNAPFSIVSDDCSRHAVPASSSCSFKVQFMPTSQGTFTDSFDIPSNASNEATVTVDLAGTGKALRVAVDQVIRSGCSGGVLELIVNVTDQNNDPLAGLLAGDFQIKENGELMSIQSVTQILTPVPISVATLLDYTTSVQNQFPTIEAASRYFMSLLRPDDRASIIKFAEKQQQMCGFSIDPAVLTTAINTAPTEIGRQNETRLYDALWFAVEKTAVEPSHKAVVVVSDGRDETYLGVPIASVKTLDEVISYAAANQVAIYTVGLGGVDGVDFGVMNRLAGETGGQYYYITDAGQLDGVDGVYKAISDILLGQYSIKYGSSSTGGSTITLEIDVVGGTYAGAGAFPVVGCP